MYRKIALLILFLASTSYADTPTINQDPFEKQLVVVFGMHRSGTSLLSKGLQVIGIDFGDHLLPGAPDNPLGFYEDIGIGSFNETALYLSGLAAHSIKNYPKALPNKERLIQYGTHLIQSKTAQKPLFGFKDPRTARNAILWKEIFQNLPDTTIQVIVIFRHPISVAQSLFRRNNIDPIRSYYLWLQYYAAALSIIDQFETHFVCYEHLVQNPYTEMVRLGKDLGLSLSSQMESKLKNFAKHYVTPSMQHHQNPGDTIDREKDLPIEVKTLYRHLLKTNAKSLNKQNLLELTKKTQQRLQDMGPLLKMIDHVEDIGESKEHRFFALIDELINAPK